MNQKIKHWLSAASAVALSLGAIGSASAATNTITSAIEQSTVWTSDNVYLLHDLIFVRSNATLTIEAGTTVLGSPDTATPGANNPGTLVITRGSKLKALGTEEAPIVFKGTEVDDGAGQWGGIVINGRAYLAKGTLSGPNGDTTSQVEGLSALAANGLYGGNDDDDDSGIIRYVSIRNAGFGLAANNELNGLGMACVGRETAMDHVEIFNNVDDGFEWWGGTINAKYLVVYNAGDDSFDIDEGFRGKLQFCFGIQGDAERVSGTPTVGGGISDRGLECDGGNAPDGSQPYALWKGYNWTLIGKGSTLGIANVGLYIRDNGSPQLWNSIIADFAGNAVHVENEGGDGAINSQTRFLTPWVNSFPITNNPTFYRTETNGYHAMLMHNIFYANGGLVSLTPAELAADASHGAETYSQSGNSTNVFTLPSCVGNITNATAWPIQGGVPLRVGINVTNINPLAANDATNSPVSAPIDGFFTPVNYRGAFSTTNLWVANWTRIWEKGIVPTSHVNPSAPAISVVITNGQTEISMATGAGVQYSLETSYDGKHWHPITLINGDGTTQTYVDVSPLTNTVIYRAVVP
jgi:hypothetical protein